MRIVRYIAAAAEAYGIMDDEVIRPIVGLPWKGIKPTGDEYLPEEVTLLPPVQPPNVFAIGLNYKRHADECGMKYPPAPVIFLKAASAVIGSGDDIILPDMAPDEVDYEAELAIVIGRTCRYVSEYEALDYVLGYTCSNDVSARDCQMKQDAQWARAKSFDTFCPLGPWIETELEPDGLDIMLRLNGTVMQSSNTSDMLFDCRNLISYCSRIATLHPGTVIMTGTPSGVGFSRNPPVFLKPGDRVEVEIEGIGTLYNGVRSQS
ncbi:MAG: fumarylacetoacetate hydrolase family protein [bacterium]|jgi:2-keto-4-pentenoate hydratase/2-oxohepta-3-ene-1,7-dioic acid hydratase in catechol pathway|nr:fumarylacetoacetate hydrolase family protein [bacterium]MDD3805654.1 fumarylacetoacetate hydrolase family protein [bacterium]MDD4152455.1 fumarylacetoacetate hydrolase family protein [bacterium]MDD4557449.1 fumarylacetoacetate hydrolase family protein [bacterium]